MKEKYIFFILLIIVLVMLIGARAGKGAKAEISAEELAIEKNLRRAAQEKPALAERIDMDKVQDLLAFSYYEPMLKRSLFFKPQPKRALAAKAEIEVLPVEDRTPMFIYKGKIAAGNRQVVIIEQPRSGEVVMVSLGENVGGYKVLDITDTEVILSKKGAENIILKTIKRP